VGLDCRVALWRKAADRGHAESQARLGMCYCNGSGVDQNLELAVEWTRKAADVGCAGAQFCMGEFHGYGTGVVKDNAQAVPPGCRPRPRDGSIPAGRARREP